MSLFDKLSLLLLCPGHPAIFFFRLSEVNSNLFNCGENNQEISVQIFCQQFTCEVLIDYSAGTL